MTERRLFASALPPWAWLALTIVYAVLLAAVSVLIIAIVFT